MKSNVALAVLVLLASRAPAQELDPKIMEMEKARVAAIEKVKPSVVAVFGKGGAGGGSGVLIDDQGYALTNFHVVEGSGPVMKCGLPDGILYDGVLVGLDKVGDVALIKLLPKKPGDKFPFAKLGDSDKVRAGDWSLAMGNPFLLATDFTPTVTFGLVSGVQRYQYPAGTLLEYTNCIQIDTSINPGNSGGPLFNMDGELIGINGRGSFEKRGRVNSGVGYAISINQIKNFMGQLRSGLDTDHASIGASIETDAEEAVLGKLLVKGLIECDAQRRGLELGDELVGFGPVTRLSSVNQFKNILGLYPRGWRVPMIYRHNQDRREVLVRLMGVQRQELPPAQPIDNPQPGDPPMPQPRPMPQPQVKHDMYEPKKGFANFYFNKVEKDRLVKEIKEKMGDFSTLSGDWDIKSAGTVKDKRTTAEFAIVEKGSADGKNDVVKATIDGLIYNVAPLETSVSTDVMRDPPNSGGLLMALYHWRQLLVYGEKGFVGEFIHGGVEPCYSLPQGKDKPDYAKLRVDCEVLRTKHAGVPAKWFFVAEGPNKGLLMAAEVTVPTRDPSDPCELYFDDYKKVDGRMLPQTITVKYGDKTYAVFNAPTYTLKAGK
jgi:S1-C subfamily serine protease